MCETVRERVLGEVGGICLLLCVCRCLNSGREECFIS